VKKDLNLDETSPPKGKLRGGRPYREKGVTPNDRRAVKKTLDFGVPGVPLLSGDHICALYVSQAERDRMMLPFLRAGLRAGHKCFCVVDSSPTSQVLEDVGDDVETKEALSRHQLELFTAGESYLRTRPFTTEGILDLWREIVPVAAAEGGYAFSRVTAEMPWALHDLPDEREEFFRYEAELNRFAPGTPSDRLPLRPGTFWRRHPSRPVADTSEAGCEWTACGEPVLPPSRPAPLREVLTLVDRTADPAYPTHRRGP
jgi:hypothetical protein